MTRTARHRGAVAALVLALVAAAAWWIDARTRPERVGPRFVDALLARHPGTTVQTLDGVLRAALPSGVYVDVHLPRVFDACRSARLGCADAIDRALGDVDRSEAATDAPQRDRLRPIVVGEPGGYRYGYVADPLVGPFEVRYALVDGVASTFVTETIAARLALSRDALRAAALSGLAAERDVRLEPLDDAGRVPIFRVRSGGDAAASLLDRGRMARFAAQIGSSTLYAAIPLRGTLLLAAASDAAGPALAAAGKRLRGADARTLDGGVLAYDVDAPDGHALSIATLSPALRRP